MTPKQKERIQKKIAQYKKALAADKKFWGGQYHDGGGLRYGPLELYIKLKDYKGGLRYLRWFFRTFPDDVCYPLFLLEATLILFKNGKFKEAAKMALETNLSNFFILDVFLETHFTATFTEVGYSKWNIDMATDLPYSKTDPEYVDFSNWLEATCSKPNFAETVNRAKQLSLQVNASPSGPERSRLLDQLHGIGADFTP